MTEAGGRSATQVAEFLAHLVIARVGVDRDRTGQASPAREPRRSEEHERSLAQPCLIGRR